MAAAADWGMPVAERAEKKAAVYPAEVGRTSRRHRIRSTCLRL